METISWKNVFNSNISNIRWGRIDNANHAAKSAGYKYFTWNDWVYTVDGLQPDIHVDMLDEQLAKNDCLVLSVNDLKKLHELPADDVHETDMMTAHRMGRNSLVLELISRIKEPDYESN